MCTHRGGAATLGTDGARTRVTESAYNAALAAGQDGYAEYSDAQSAEEAMGFGNSGEADRWVSQLSSDEEDAIWVYTNSGYRAWNSGLRGQAQLTDYDIAQIAHIRASLSRFNLTRDIVTHRGVGADAFGLPKNATPAQLLAHIQSLVGGTITDRGFTSSSLVQSGAFDAGAVMHIQTPRGRGRGAFVTPVSGATVDESEFLYTSGSRFQILGAYMQGGKVHINARWTGNDG